jgi:hypothetical protein
MNEEELNEFIKLFKRFDDENERLCRGEFRETLPLILMDFEKRLKKLETEK